MDKIVSTAMFWKYVQQFNYKVLTKNYEQFVWLDRVLRWQDDVLDTTGSRR